MALIINDECASCDACIDSCPNEAISEGDIYVINSLLCTECVGAKDEPQCVLECPAECIVADPNHVETKEQLQQKYETLH